MQGNQKKAQSRSVSLSQSSEQLHNAVHFNAAFKNLHAPRHPFLQPQWMSSWHDIEASASTDQNGTQVPSSFCQPNKSGEGILGFATKQLPQITLPW